MFEFLAYKWRGFAERRSFHMESSLPWVHKSPLSTSRFAEFFVCQWPLLFEHSYEWKFWSHLEALPQAVFLGRLLTRRRRAPTAQSQNRIFSLSQDYVWGRGHWVFGRTLNGRLSIMRPRQPKYHGWTKSIVRIHTQELIKPPLAAKGCWEALQKEIFCWRCENPSNTSPHPPY